MSKHCRICHLRGGCGCLYATPELCKKCYAACVGTTLTPEMAIEHEARRMAMARETEQSSQQSK